MCPPRLFLPSRVPTELFFGSELLLWEQSCCQGWGWMSLGASDSLAQAVSHPYTY